MIIIPPQKGINPVAVAASLTLLLFASLSLTGCSNTNLLSGKTPQEVAKDVNIDDTITLEQVTRDVTFLASDELRGRNNFTSDIGKAADFIAKRFAEVGLIPAQNSVSFKQHYTVQRISPHTLNVQINGQVISRENLTMATNLTNIDWDNNRQNSSARVNTVMIGEHDNMRKKLRKLNHHGGQYLVLLHPKHEKSFKRYQSYFARGLTKLVSKDKKGKITKQGGAIVIALSDISQIKNFSVKGHAKVNETTLSNVIGVLPGKSKANEIVLYSAHYDHLGVKSNLNGAPQHSAQIFNGADDDASGVSAIINLANHFTQRGNNERTLMFAAFSAEEIGGFGSRYFSTHLDPKHITAMINIEMIGKPAMFGEGTVWMTGMDRSNLGEQLNHTLAPKNLKIYANPYPQQKLFYRSDNATLARLGVPAHSFSSTQLDKDPHYHQVTDDINSLNLPSMLQVIKTLAIATTPLVDGSITPSRIDPNKLKRKGLIY